MSDDIELVLEDDAGGSESQATETDKALSPAEGLDALKTKLAAADAEKEAERQRRVAAEQRAREASEGERKANQEVQDTNLSLVENAIQRVEAVRDNIKAQLAAAHQAQDFDQVAEMQSQLSERAAELVQLRAGKQALEQAPKPETRKTDPIIDPVEAVASQCSPRSAAWVRRHPDFARDPRKFNAMIGAHNIAISDGLEADTDDYFGRIETILGVGADAPVKVSEDSLSGAAAGSGRRSASPPAAPVSRGGDGNGSTNRNVVRLSADEREMARNMGLSDQEYAKNKLALIKEGKIQVH